MNRRELQQRRQKYRRRGKIFVASLALLFVAAIGALLFVNYPRLELVGGQIIELSTHDKFDDPGIRLKNTGKDLAPDEYQIESELDVTQEGEYQVNYMVSYFGLKSKATRKIKVIRPKEIAPVEMALNGPEQVNLYLGREYEELGAHVAGGDDANIQDKLEITGTVDINTPGSYEITYQVTDALGNIHQLTRAVNVVEKRIYLTFDDGPNETVTPQFLQVLREMNIKGTFFVTGFGPDELIKQAYDEGHTIGLHTHDHDYANVYASVDHYFKDLAKIEERVKRITGVDSKIIRFPGGSSNGISANYTKGIMTKLVKQVKDKGYQYFDWNVSSGDGSNQASAEIPFNNVTTHLMDGEDNVVLMHDTKQTSADALRNIIDYGIAHGFAFEKLEMDSFPAQHEPTN